MTTTMGINGFGRIGRVFTRIALERSDLRVLAVNDITDARTLAHLLEFDSTYGRLGVSVEYTPNSLVVGGTPIAVLSRRDPAEIDWKGPGADIVIESTGKFRTREAAGLHLAVVLSREVTADAVNEAFAAAAAGPMAGIVRYSTDPVVSRDIIGDPASCVFDAELTQAAGTLAKVFGWYDNEWAYACRLADLAAFVGRDL